MFRVGVCLMSKTYSFLDVINANLDLALQDLHTCLPARIVKYNPETQRATVQPLIKDKSRDDTRDFSLIQGIPVVFPSDGLGNSIMTFPVAIGSIVIVWFFERNADTFKLSEGDTPVAPDDARMHDYNDAVAVAGLYPFGKAIGSHPTDTVIRMNVDTELESNIHLTPSGNIIINSAKDTNINIGQNATINVTGTADVTVGGKTTLNSNGVEVNSTLSEFNGNVVVNGNINCSQTVTATTDVLGGGKSLKTHT